MAAVEDDDPVDPSDELVFTGLGGCQEVGRSCHILQYKGKTIMVCPSAATADRVILTSAARRWYAYRPRRNVCNALLRRLRSQYSRYPPHQPVRPSSPTPALSSLSSWDFRGQHGGILQRSLKTAVMEPQAGLCSGEQFCISSSEDQYNSVPHIPLSRHAPPAML